jgi:hypothetical protein
MSRLGDQCAKCDLLTKELNDLRGRALVLDEEERTRLAAVLDWYLGHCIAQGMERFVEGVAEKEVLDRIAAKLRALGGEQEEPK